MFRQRKRNYPLYDTTVFRDFRVMIDQSAALWPERVALSYKDSPFDAETRHITYATAREEIRALGERLVDLGLREHKVMLLGKVSWQWVYAYLGLMAVGAVTVPLDRDLSPDEIADVARRTDCRAVFYGTECKEKMTSICSLWPGMLTVAMGPGAEAGEKTVESLIRDGFELLSDGKHAYDDYDLDPDAVASIVFTSGTTGRSKGVMLSQTNIVSDMTRGMYHFAITPKTLMVLPPHHTFGSTVNLVGHYAQGAEVYLSSGLKYFQKELSEQKPGHLILVPLFLETLAKKIWATAEREGKAARLRRALALNRRLHKVGLDLGGLFFGPIKKMLGGELKMIICGGAALPQQVIDTFDGLGIAVLNGYGITECAPLVTCNRNEYRKPGSVGLPIVGEEVRIADPDENGEGEVLVRGSNVMCGYFDDPEATAAAVDADGFFHTGDWGRLDSEGWLYLTGRQKNMILFSNGKNVYPEELELALSSIYGVGEVVVYAGDCAADPAREVIVAEIFPDREALAQRRITDPAAYFDAEVKAKNAAMPPYKRVHIVKLRETEFAKNTSRKIIRAKIDRTV